MSNAKDFGDSEALHNASLRGEHDANSSSGRQVVPLIPMPDNVVFPHSTQHLTLRGEQAESIARSALTEEGLAALFLQRPTPPGADPTVTDLAQVGTLARFTEIGWDDGSIHVTAEGIKIVRLVQVTQWAPHVETLVEPIARPEEDAEQLNTLYRQARELYLQLLGRDAELSRRMGPMVDKTTEPEALAFLIASTVPISPAARQTLLETHTLSATFITLISYLNKALEISTPGQDQTGPQASSSATTGSSEAPQHVDSATLDRVNLEEKLRNAELSPEVAETVRRELERLSLLAPSSPDYNLTRTYVQWLADLPWTPSPDPPIDLTHAAAVLDRDHYGLEDIKQRIVEHLAVRQLRLQRGTRAAQGLSGEPPRQPVLCLVGPPGVGKTSLGRSIAEALQRPFVRISLGGVTDEAEIRGHRRTYVGAMPGRIIQSLARAGSNQPLIMLDELDKVNRDNKGDPTSALLDVLDPEQQQVFVDHYLGIPFDISCVFFIATANTLETVPDALRDRLEVIRLAGYTEDEKLQIALGHLIPRQMEWHALGARDARWEEEAALLVIRNFTRESGVRQLDREIATICRRIASLVAQEHGGTLSEPFVVDDQFVGEILGTPRFLPAEPLDTDQPGVVTGAFWTPVGGDIMHIEALMMPGEKTLTITGQLGEVMRESAQAALSYVRSRAESLGIDPTFFDTNDIHLHIPSGAVSKDGPSAGVALALALISLLKAIPVPSDLAVTGELTLRGKILPVGGIKEKVLAARRVGIRRVLIPALNRPDLDSLQPDILSEVEILEVDTMDEVLSAAFGESLAIQHSLPVQA